MLHLVFYYIYVSKLACIFVNFVKTVLKKFVQNGTTCTIYVMTLKPNLHVYI
jgi:hypothetical protein